MKKLTSALLGLLFVCVNTNFASEADVQDSVSPSSIPDRLESLIKQLQSVARELEILGSRVKPTLPNQRITWEKRLNELQNKKYALQDQIRQLRHQLNNDELYQSILRRLK